MSENEFKGIPIHCEPQREYEDSPKADKDRVNALIAAWIEGYVEEIKPTHT